MYKIKQIFKFEDKKKANNFIIGNKSNNTDDKQVDDSKIDNNKKISKVLFQLLSLLKILDLENELLKLSFNENVLFLKIK